MGSKAMRRITADDFGPVVPILLAAGLSRRMGATNKLLLPVNGVPLVRHVARSVTSIGKTIVVVGHEAEAVSAALDGLNVHIVYNDKYEDGQMTSVSVGLAAAPLAAHYMIALADQPRLEPADCQNLVAAHMGAMTGQKAGQKTGQITIPLRPSIDPQNMKDSHERGNPIILDQNARDDILKGGTNLGCRGLLDRRPDIIYPYETTADGFFTDLDTPQEFAVEQTLFSNPTIPA